MWIIYYLSGETMKRKMKQSKPKDEYCRCGHRSEGYKISDFDPEKVREGTEIEYEHTCNTKLAERIAIDHISENGYQYYPELKKMERKLRNLNKGKEYMEDKRVHKRKCK